MTEIATFGAGCFWGVEKAFRKLPGVLETLVGYAGGQTKDPTYEQVCSNGTGHAEVVQVEFDPQQISYEELLITFWQCHNPTTPDRQGADVGSQYRSVIFYHSKQQKEVAQASKVKLDETGIFNDPIVTQILPISDFYRAEEYHQNYYEKNQ